MAADVGIYHRDDAWKMICAVEIHRARSELIYHLTYYVERFGVKIVIDGRDVLSRRLFFHGRWEDEVAACIFGMLRPGMTFFDVGANIGFFTLLASKIVGRNGTVHSFEPDRQNFARLTQNIRQNNLVNIRANRIGLETKRAS